MTLDVDPPAPPSLSPASGDEDHRRAQLQARLEDGAWEQAFESWAADTDLDEEAWAVVLDLDLVARFDFFWDDIADRVGYDAPGIPEDWREREIHPDLDSWETVSGINAGLAALGRTVSDVLKADYVDWESDGVDAGELPDFE
ncbi:MAG: hypothetical protein ABEJ89_01305 [Haloarculaceae archaeon]